MGASQGQSLAYLPARGIWGITKPQCLVVAAGLTLSQLLGYCCTKCAADGIISGRLGLCYGRPGTFSQSHNIIKFIFRNQHMTNWVLCIRVLPD